MAEELDVLIVGAGFAGLLQLYQLRELGYKVKAVEAAPCLGGIWYWTSYPGARVDSEVPAYQYSIEELWREWIYTEKYPARAEILKYFEFVDKKLDLSKDVYFNTRVISTEYDAGTNKWHTRTEGGKEFVSRFLSLCVGFAAKQYDAPFEGLEKYKGIMHHSNNWPQEVDVRGKRVAVIGTGASGVQIIQEIGPQVSHLTVFQRTPNLALPARNPKLSKEEQVRDKPQYPELLKLRHENFGGFLYGSEPDSKALNNSPEAREMFYERLWALADFHFWIANYDDTLTDEKSNDEAYAFWCKKVRARLHNPEMRDKLAPLTPPHAFGTRRPSLEQRYYEVFNQDNVDLINIKENPIDCFTPTGIRTKDGVNHECDIVILATGYDQVTGALHRITIKGEKGVTMEEKWKDGIRTYLGMTSSGFPNLFITYNVHSPCVFSNGPTSIEIQGEWIVECINYLYKSGKSKVDATEEAEEKWTSNVNDTFNMTLFPNTIGPYCGSNIPGKKVEAQCYIGGIPLYLEACTRAAKEGFSGFIIS